MMEYMIQDLVEIITENQNMEYDKAMSVLYNSLVMTRLWTKRQGFRERARYMCMVYYRTS